MNWYRSHRHEVLAVVWSLLLLYSLISNRALYAAWSAFSIAYHAHRLNKSEAPV